MKHRHTGIYTRPVGSLNPTAWRIPRSPLAADATFVSDGSEPGAATTPPAAVYHLYRTRDNRKGRHAVVISPESAVEQGISHPHATNTSKEILRGIWKMVVRFPVFDVSYDVAVVFTIGSLIWVINGFFVWLPTQYPSTEFRGEVDIAGGITAFVGATVFEIGSVLLMLEAINENRTECFGWALEEAMESRGLLLRPSPEECNHHHVVQHRRVMKEQPRMGQRRIGHWEWWPAWSELKSHYLREIGFLACLAQFIGVTIFWISGFTSLAPIYNTLTKPVANGMYW